MKSSATITLRVLGRAVAVRPGSTVAAALRIADPVGLGVARSSITGEPRAPLCGMGICQECRVSVDGMRRLACQTLCAEGMQVEAIA
jgi:predicted molibdopterin-dependent oxidoreductase YjgC